MAETETPLSVDEAMIAVMREIDPVGKNGRNTKMNYRFQAYDDIVAEIAPRMAKYGLRMLPEVIDQKHFTRGSGDNVNVAILTIRYVIRGARGDVLDTPIVVVGEGADVADKASNKAMTAAKKYAYKQAFDISDGQDDGDHDHPVAARNPLGWYLGQINRGEVWKNPSALHALLERAAGAGLAELHMPDRPGTTFRQVIEAQRNKLHAEQQARAERKATEHQAFRAQMAAEYPDPPDPYDDAWENEATHQPVPAPAPATYVPPPPAPVHVPAPPAPAQMPPALPDAEAIEQQLAEAMADAENAEQHLHALRAQHGAAVLAQVIVRSSEWGTVDANSAISMALLSKAPAQPRPEPTPETPAESPTSTAPSAARQAPLAEPRRARRAAGMTAEERAQANMIAEAEFQAQMLGTDTLEFVADLLPSGAASIDDIQGGSRLQDHIRSHRATVLAAIQAQNLTHVAEEYTKLGDRVPAQNFNKFIDAILQQR
ncbi:ERF family protein [Streptomyces microflavus]|uniref:ERF family protein n=1 Tax=Streptomyces microflavus TaxID=1919 RepID=UPI003401E686